MNTKLTRAAAAVGGLAITAAFAVSCAETKDAAKDMASSAASVGSSAASAAGSAVSSGASVAGSAASSGVSVASSVVSSALNRAPDAAPGKTVAAETVEKTSSSKWWWIPVGIAVAALLAGVMRMLTRRKPEPVKVAANPAPTTRGRVIDERDKRKD